MFNLKTKLEKTRSGLILPLRKLFRSGSSLSVEDADSIEEMLIGADIGFEASQRIIEKIRESGNPGKYKDILRDEFLSLLSSQGDAGETSHTGPKAVILVGVNGVGKTTTAAKLADYLLNRGNKVLLAACDTFRAAAGSQLGIWAEKTGVELIAHKSGGDPAAVAFDGCRAACARAADYVIMDTAGRLHTKTNLMEELKKIKRVCLKNLSPGAIEILMVVDATLGQNSLAQAREFTSSLDTDGIILTKLDSTAKGGMAIAIKHELGVPVRYLGLGEDLKDFTEFVPEEFVDAILA